MKITVWVARCPDCGAQSWVGVEPPDCFLFSCNACGSDNHLPRGREWMPVVAGSDMGAGWRDEVEEYVKKFIPVGHAYHIVFVSPDGEVWMGTNATNPEKIATLFDHMAAELRGPRGRQYFPDAPEEDDQT